MKCKLPVLYLASITLVLVILSGSIASTEGADYSGDWFYGTTQTKTSIKMSSSPDLYSKADSVEQFGISEQSEESSFSQPEEDTTPEATVPPVEAESDSETSDDMSTDNSGHSSEPRSTQEPANDTSTDENAAATEGEAPDSDEKATGREAALGMVPIEVVQPGNQ